MFRASLLPGVVGASLLSGVVGTASLPGVVGTASLSGMTGRLPLAAGQFHVLHARRRRQGTITGYCDGRSEC